MIYLNIIIKFHTELSGFVSFMLICQYKNVLRNILLLKRAKNYRDSINWYIQ